MSYKLLNGHDDDDDLAIAATQPNNKWSKNFWRKAASHVVQRTNCTFCCGLNDHFCCVHCSRDSQCSFSGPDNPKKLQLPMLALGFGLVLVVRLQWGLRFPDAEWVKRPVVFPTCRRRRLPNKNITRKYMQSYRHADPRRQQQHTSLATVRPWRFS